MSEAILAELLIRMGIRALIAWEKYRVTGKLELDPAMKEQLRIFSQRDEILKPYNTSIEEITKQLAEHERDE